MPEKKNTIGRFEIVAKIGEGPIGTVYKALDPVIRRTVAIKVIKLYALEETTTFAEIFEKIYRVVRTSTSLNHPNICIIYDLSEEKKIPYITMEYVDGHDLDSLLRKKHQFKKGELLNILQQTCDALDFAHRKNVIHQDLKSTNILVNPDLHVKITDFGIAGLDEIAAAQTKKLLTIPFYISPEQALGERVSPASDLFSLGVVMYHLLSGQLPFPGTSAANTIMMIARDHPRVPADLEKSGISRDDWESFFSIALAKSPSHRFRNARETCEALSAILPESEKSYFPYAFSSELNEATGKYEKPKLEDTYSPTLMIDAAKLTPPEVPVPPPIPSLEQEESEVDLSEVSDTLDALPQQPPAEEMPWDKPAEEMPWDKADEAVETPKVVAETEEPIAEVPQQATEGDIAAEEAQGPAAPESVDNTAELPEEFSEVSPPEIPEEAEHVPTEPVVEVEAEGEAGREKIEERPAEEVESPPAPPAAPTEMIQLPMPPEAPSVNESVPEPILEQAGAPAEEEEIVEEPERTEPASPSSGPTQMIQVPSPPEIPAVEEPAPEPTAEQVAAPPEEEAEEHGQAEPASASYGPTQMIHVPIVESPKEEPVSVPPPVPEAPEEPVASPAPRSPESPKAQADLYESDLYNAPTRMQDAELPGAEPEPPKPPEEERKSERTPPPKPAAPSPAPAPVSEKKMPNLARYMMGAVVLAIVVGLIGTGILIFRKKGPEEPSPSQPVTPAPVTPAPVTPPVVETPITGTMSIMSDPEGATVFVDEEEKGVTPLELTDLELKNYALRLELKGHEDALFEIELTEEIPNTTIPFTLTKATPQVGTLVIESNPPGALIVIKNRALGNTPKTLPNTRVGNYNITLKLDGYQDFQGTVRVNAGRTGTFSGQLVEIPKPKPPPEPPKPKPPEIKRGQLVTLGPGVVPPRATKKIYPKYPEAARVKRIAGTVKIDILVDETGKVIDMKVTESAHPMLDEAVMEAYKSWVFEPATKNGVPVKVWMPVTMTFQAR